MTETATPDYAQTTKVDSLTFENFVTRFVTDVENADSPRLTLAGILFEIVGAPHLESCTHAQHHRLRKLLNHLDEQRDSARFSLTEAQLEAVRKDFKTFPFARNHLAEEEANRIAEAIGVEPDDES